MNTMRFKEVEYMSNGTNLVSGRTVFPTQFLQIPKILFLTMILYSPYHSFDLENL